MSKKLSDPTIPELTAVANNARIYVLLMDEPEGSRDRYMNVSLLASSSNSNVVSGNGSGNVTSHSSTTVNNIVVYATTTGTGVKDSGISRDALSIAITKANTALQSGDLAGYADKPYVNSAANIANSVAVGIGTAGNAFATSVGAAGNTYAASVGAASNTLATGIGASSNAWTNASITGLTTTAFAYANGTANISNSVAVSIGASSNAWTNTSMATLPTIYSSHANVTANIIAMLAYANGTANISNSVAVGIGAAGNSYAASVGAASNTLATGIGASSNAWVNTSVTALSISISQNVAYMFNVATMNLDNINESSSNIHFKASHLANLRNVMNGNGGGGLTATEAFSFSNTSANIANSVAATYAAAANGWTNASVSGLDGSVQTINETTANTYVLVLSDKGKLVASNVTIAGATANVQIPNFGNTAFADGTRIDIAKWGNTNTRITAANGVMINGNIHATLEFSGQYVAAGMHMQKANVWHAYGPLSRISISDIQQVNATNSQSLTVRIPSDTQFGDLILVYEEATNGGSIPNNTAQTNFIPIMSRTYGSTSRFSVSMKIADGTEANAIFAGMTADSLKRHIVIVFRGNVPFSNCYIGALNNVAITDSNPTAQLANVVPLGIVWAVYRSVGAVSPRTFNITSNGEHRASTSEYVKWHTANTATANAIIDMDDEGNGNFLASGTIICL